MTADDWDLRRLVGYNMQRANSVVTAGVTRILGEFGLRRASYSVLSVVVTAPALRQADVAETLSIERPNLVKVIKDLERAGWVVRRRVEGDRRAYELHPTMQGREHYIRVRHAIRDFDARLVDALGEEQRKALFTALNAIEAASLQIEQQEGNE